MKYRIEKRGGDYYIITDEKHKNDTIIINLSSVIKTDEGFINESLEKIDLLWTLRYDENNHKVYIDLLLAREESKIYTREISIMSLISELVHCVQNNKNLEDCVELNSIIGLLYEDAFCDMLENENVILRSNIIIEAYCVVKQYDNKLLGNASRFIIQKSKLSILEYVGKQIDCKPVIEINIKNKKIKMITSSGFSENKLFDPADHLLGYYSFVAMDTGITDVVEEKKDFYRIKVPIVLSTPESMYAYILANNDIDDIIKYKISMKPTLKLVNINRFMINEYSR